MVEKLVLGLGDPVPANRVEEGRGMVLEHFNRYLQEDVAPQLPEGYRIGEVRGVRFDARSGRYVISVTGGSFERPEIGEDTDREAAKRDLMRAVVLLNASCNLYSRANSIDVILDRDLLSQS